MDFGIKEIAGALLSALSVVLGWVWKTHNTVSNHKTRIEALEALMVKTEVEHKEIRDFMRENKDKQSAMHNDLKLSFVELSTEHKTSYAAFMSRLERMENNISKLYEKSK